MPAELKTQLDTRGRETIARAPIVHTYSIVPDVSDVKKNMRRYGSERTGDFYFTRLALLIEK